MATTCTGALLVGVNRQTAEHQRVLVRSERDRLGELRVADNGLALGHKDVLRQSLRSEQGCAGRPRPSWRDVCSPGNRVHPGECGLVLQPGLSDLGSQHQSPVAAQDGSVCATGAVKLARSPRRVRDPRQHRRASAGGQHRRTVFYFPRRRSTASTAVQPSGMSESIRATPSRSAPSVTIGTSL